MHLGYDTWWYRSWKGFAEVPRSGDGIRRFCEFHLWWWFIESSTLRPDLRAGLQLLRRGVLPTVNELAHHLSMVTTVSWEWTAIMLLRGNSSFSMSWSSALSRSGSIKEIAKIFHAVPIVSDKPRRSMLLIEDNRKSGSAARRSSTTNVDRSQLLARRTGGFDRVTNSTYPKIK